MNMENTNSVCYVGKIKQIKEIENADNIEQVFIGGWSCITKKGEYRINDLVIVATTDAVIPQKLSDALGVTNYLRKGQRVRTVKLRGVYSECLIIPITLIPEKYRGIEGTDCMELLEIFKYEPPAVQIQLSTGKKIRYHQNPNFRVYYKFPNLKNVTGMFTEQDKVQITRKIHGTNARYGIVRKAKLSFLDKIKKYFKLDKWVEYEFVYGSHNVEKGSDSQGFYSTDVWKTVNEKYNIKTRLWDLVKLFHPSEIGTGIVLYGEIFGPGIQKNYDYKLPDIEFAAFDVTLNGEYLPTRTAFRSITKDLRLSHVPVLYDGNWSQEIQDSFVLKNYIESTKIPHEGIVIKEVSGNRSRVAKVINPEYLTYSEKNDVGDSH